MGSRAFPVPLYATSATLSGFGTKFRALTPTSPGSTDSTASVTTYALAARQTFLTPEAANNATADFFPTTLAGEIQGHGGWVLLPVGPLVPTANDAWSVDAGTWSVQFHVSRSSGLTDSNVTGVTLRAQLVRVAGFATGPDNLILQNLGSASKAAVTITTTETAHQLDISANAATFNPGEKLVLCLFWEWALQLSLTGTARCHTNSTTASRITAAPAYTILYNRSLADSSGAITDSIQRAATYARMLPDTVGAPTDTLARVAMFPRQLSDAPGAVGDSLDRDATYFRRLDDSVATPADAVTRLASFNRRLADTAPVTDTLDRDAAYNRFMADSAPAVTDVLTRIYTANRRLADTVDAPADALARFATYGRYLNDSAPVNDVLTRAATYRRALFDDLTSGGGDTIVYKRPIYLFPED